MARIVWTPGWEQWLDREIHKFMVNLADDVLDTMRGLCPVDTGTLKADLAKEVNGKIARVGAKSVPYAIYVEEGTGPHIIEPNTKQALDWPGAPHPVNIVYHPGAEASHFMKRSLYFQRRP